MPRRRRDKRRRPWSVWCQPRSPLPLDPTKEQLFQCMPIITFDSKFSVYRVHEVNLHG